MKSDRLFKTGFRQFTVDAAAALEDGHLYSIIVYGLNASNWCRLSDAEARLPVDFDDEYDGVIDDSRGSELAQLPYALEASLPVLPEPDATKEFNKKVPDNTILLCERCGRCYDTEFELLGFRDNLGLSEQDSRIREMSYIHCPTKSTDDEHRCKPSRHWIDLQDRYTDVRLESFAQFGVSMMAAPGTMVPAIPGDVFGGEIDDGSPVAVLVSMYRASRVAWHKAVKDADMIGGQVDAPNPGGDIVTDWFLYKAGFLDDMCLHRLYGLDEEAVALMMRWASWWESAVWCIDSYAGIRETLSRQKRRLGLRIVARINESLHVVRETEQRLEADPNMDNLDIFEAISFKVRNQFLRLDSFIIGDLPTNKIVAANL